jgi:hypothetical protein
MLKKFLLLSLVLTGCAQLQHGEEQPVLTKNAEKSIYFTSCSGAAEGWFDCYEKAKRTCKGTYRTLDKGDDSRGTKRTLTFQCQ